jgi:hypothetical protein
VTATNAQAWRVGADLAIALIENIEEADYGETMLDPDDREGRPQLNVVLHYLDTLRGISDRRAEEAFGAVLTDLVSSCQHAGVPYTEALERHSRKPIATIVEMPAAGGAA